MLEPFFKVTFTTVVHNVNLEELRGWTASKRRRFWDLFANALHSAYTQIQPIDAGYLAVKGKDQLEVSSYVIYKGESILCIQVLLFKLNTLVLGFIYGMKMLTCNLQVN